MPLSIFTPRLPDGTLDPIHAQVKGQEFEWTDPETETETELLEQLRTSILAQSARLQYLQFNREARQRIRSIAGDAAGPR